MRDRIRKAKATLSDVSVNATLTNFSVSYMQDNEDFVHDKVFPVVPVDEKTGSYFVFNRGDIFRTDAERRTPGGKAARKTFGVSTSTYTLENWALAYELPDEHRSANGSPLADDATSVEILTHDLMIRREIAWGSAYFGASIWGTDYDGATADFAQWTDASPTILSDVRTWNRQVKAQCGKWANTAVTTPDVMDTILEDPDIVDRIKYTSKEPVSRELVARLMGLDRILVMSAIQNTSVEGTADGSLSTSFIQSNGFLLCYTEPSPALRKRSAGYTLSWSEFDEVEAGAAAIRSWRDEDIRSDVFQGDMFFQFAVIDSNCRIFADNVFED